MRILGCSDGSEQATRALALAGRLAAAHHAEVTLLGITENESEEPAVHAALRRALKEFQRQGIRAELVTKAGEPVAEIARKAQESPYDLVVIGAQRRGQGDVSIPPAKAYAIIEAVPGPVLVAVGEERGLRRILVGTRGGPRIEPALRFTGQIAQGGSATVTLLTVLPSLGGIHAGLTRREPDAEALLRSNSALARDLQAEKRRIEGFGVRTAVQVRHGLVVEEILKELKQGGHDLLVLGARPTPPSWRRYLLDDVTREIVYHADRPVLVVRGRAERPAWRDKLRRSISGLFAVFPRRRPPPAPGRQVPLSPA
ncbi:MAG TPA: universal stress protein [Chthoniobacterales bacterium]